MKRFHLVLLVVGTFSCSEERRLPEPKTEPSIGNTYQEPPDYFHMCYKNDIDFKDCFTKTLRGIHKRMVDGIPEMYVPPLEPLYLAKVDAFDMIGLRFQLQNILAQGASNLTITPIRASLETGIHEFIGSIDRVLLSSDLVLSSSIPLVEFVLTGKASATLLNINFHADGRSKVVNRNGTDFLSVEKLDLKLTVGSGTGEAWIGEQKLDLLSQIVSTPFNFRIIINTFVSALEPVFGGIMLRFATRLFSSVPYDKLIPDIRPGTNMSRMSRPYSSAMHGMKFTEHIGHTYLDPCNVTFCKT